MSIKRSHAALADATNKANQQSIHSTGKSAPQSKEPQTLPKSNGTKRKSDAQAQMEIGEPNIDDVEVFAPYGMPDQNCDQVRRKITAFLDSGEMTKGAFCDKIGVSGNSLNRFLGQTGGRKGQACAAYSGAWEYFEKRRIAGLKMPKKAKVDEAKAKNDGKSVAAKKPADINTVRLDFEEYDDVPVYEICDQVRKKIAAHLRAPGVTQAQFLRDLVNQYNTSKRPARIQSVQLQTFRGRSGPDAGNTSCVFYAAYVYFEKLRIAEGKPKTKHRAEMEEAWPGGFNISRPGGGGRRTYWCAGSAKPHTDSLGRVSIF